MAVPTPVPVFELLVLQWITTAALTLASVTIALVAMIFAYRQNYGWKPVILVLSQNVSDMPDRWDVSIEFEVWNRRKYPIAIHFIEIKFGDLELRDPIPQQGPDGHPAQWWYVFHNKLICRDQAGLDLASHKRFKPSVPIRKRSPNEHKETAMGETVIIDVYYFDPLANARRTATLEHKLEFFGVME